MKSHFPALLTIFLLTTPLAALAEQLIPAGSLVQCTVSEPKLSSKTADVGDPVLCQVSHVELYGRSVFPYGSYMEGRFEEYKDPGHFVGKGWMELKFDRMVLPPDRVIPVAAKVVYVPNYPVDKEGRIHGKGHPVRDIVEWSIPVLWPIDILNLPRRGPRPVLKAETRLTLKIMDDLGVPEPQEAYSSQPYAQPRDSYGFAQRPPSYAPQQYVPQQAPPTTQLMSAGPVTQGPRPLTVLMMRDGYARLAQEYWFVGDSQVRYIATNGAAVIIPMELLDLPATAEANRLRGNTFAVRSAGY